ncbi:DUF4173 domain-containing protein [uncultured Psychroserpens sp.]|uniref:DUF4153 domain-containing protein n=1 Tax=uncultured Psychroserpens sp. TaxID=255436 RepID=UPI00261006B6|nr:DUF4173 domain-containing protein [uncultured Psychroserpens sp.]
MKQISVIIASFLFSLLFFEKYIGLNLSIFSIITIVFLGVYNPVKFKDKTVLLFTLAYLLTAVFVFVQHSYLSIIANCVAFFTLVGRVSQSNTSIYVNWLNGLYTTIAGFFHRNIQVDEDKTKVKWNKDIDVLHWTKLIGIPLFFVIMFVLLYKNGNPVFNDLISKIDFSFINVQWVLFSVLGYYLFSNISKPIRVEPATSTDLNVKNELLKSDDFSEEKLQKEKQLGTTLIGLLNLLIVFYIVTDISYLMTNQTVKASVFSSQVHSGINTLISSIIIAIIIILYVFRGNLNFYKENKVLKYLTYTWIILNALLIVLIAIKNHNYITAFGLTYKRIGVHIYILLAFIGLITTFIKVLSIKNMAFLFRRNTQIAFIALIGFSSINWDHAITSYNLNHAKSFDLDYLIGLSENNALLLKKYSQKAELSSNYYNRIDKKYATYLQRTEERSWQEKAYADFYLTENDKSL